MEYVMLLISASTAFAQLDAFNLRSKYGAPIDRETFKVRPGIEMVVDYGPGRQVCRIELPSGVRIVGAPSPGAVTKQQIDAVLDEVLPPEIRGKELGRMVKAMGLSTLLVTEYEHLTIAESQAGDVGKGITVTFKDASCPTRQDAP